MSALGVLYQKRVEFMRREEDLVHWSYRKDPQPFVRNHKTLRDIRAYHEEHPDNWLYLKEVWHSVHLEHDEELLRMLVEFGADPTDIDQRHLWKNATACVLSRSALHFLYDTVGVDPFHCDDYGLFPQKPMDMDLLRFVLRICGEVPREWDFTGFPLELTASRELVDSFAAMASLGLADASFFAAAEKQLVALRGAEAFLLEYRRSGLWRRSRAEVVEIAAKHGHLRLLRDALREDEREREREDRSPSSSTRALRSSRQSARDAAARDAALLRSALLGTDRLDVLQMLTSEFGASVNTVGGDGATVLHSLARSPARHAREAARWLLAETDFSLLGAEHGQHGSAVDVAAAGLHFDLLELLLHHAHGFPLPLSPRDLRQRRVHGLPFVAYVCSRTAIPESSALLCVKELLRRGARIDAQDSVRGDTALMHAVRQQRWELACGLVRDFDAPLEQTNNEGETALSIIRKPQKDMLLQLVLDAFWRPKKKKRNVF